MPHKFDVRFFTPDQEALFQRCLDQIPNVENVIVQPLDRSGYSGATVFVFFPKGQHSHPHVGKIHNKRGIEREVNGRNLAYHVFDEATQRQFHAVADGGADLAILATPLIANEDNAVTELKDFLFDRNKSVTDPRDRDNWYSKPIGFILQTFENIYKKNCRKCIDRVASAKRPLGLEYEWYLRDNRSKPLLTTWLGRVANESKVEVYGRSVPNPITLVDRIKKTERTIALTIVHGDLHPSNVVLDGRGSPNLIDFSWCADPAHIFKDFLVMECSIRFFMSPRHINPVCQSIIDSTLLNPEDESVDKMCAMLKDEQVDGGTVLHAERCAHIVMQLRKLAEYACGSAGFDLRDYISCQALVLYGLAFIERYPFNTCANALGLMGDFLEQHDYFS